jgi:plastocyanin
MKTPTRTLLALTLVAALAACAPAGDAGDATTEPMSSMAEMSTEPMPSSEPMASASASEDAMASHDMGGMGETITVDITNFVFVQEAIEINVGDTVEWVNNDATRHTITSGTDDTADGTFDSGDVEAGDSFSFTFTEAGDFAYFCDIHPTMTGTVTVAP